MIFIEKGKSIERELCCKCERLIERKKLIERELRAGTKTVILKICPDCKGRP